MNKQTFLLSTGWILFGLLSLSLIFGFSWSKTYLSELPQVVINQAEKISNGEPYCFVVPITGVFAYENHLVNRIPISSFIEKETFSPYPALIDRLIKGEHPNWLERPFHFGLVIEGVSFQWSFKNKSFYENGIGDFDFSDTKNLPTECLTSNTE